MRTINKRFSNFPFAHRQPNHAGHCRLLHGHNWDFELCFGCDDHHTDANGFVLDFGNMKEVRKWLEAHFDHTLVVNHEDLEFFNTSRRLEELGFARVVRVPNCGAEGLAEFVYHGINAMLGNLVGPDSKTASVLGEDGRRTKGWRRVYLMSVTVFEDDRNSATHAPEEPAYYQHEPNPGDE